MQVWLYRVCTTARATVPSACGVHAVETTRTVCNVTLSGSLQHVHTPIQRDSSLARCRQWLSWRAFANVRAVVASLFHLLRTVTVRTGYRQKDTGGSRGTHTRDTRRTGRSAAADRADRGQAATVN